MSLYRSLIVSETGTSGESVTIPVHGSYELTQTYETLTAETIYRHLDGSAARRRSWTGKIRSTINGRGVIPSALYNFVTNATGQLVVSCVAHRSVRSTTGANIKIPKNRRFDLTLPTLAGGVTGNRTAYCRAWDGDNYVSVTGGIDDGPTGADYHYFQPFLATGEKHESYEVIYLPELTGYVSFDTEEYTQNSGWSWSMTIEEA